MMADGVSALAALVPLGVAFGAAPVVFVVLLSQLARTFRNITLG